MKPIITVFFMTALMMTPTAHAGPLDPDCAAEKAAKGAAMKATVGVGNRCSPKEAVTDTAKGAAGIEDKGPIEKKRGDDDGMAKKATEKVAE
ncbi:MAG: hypothetical protein U9Q81_03375 [Pseudomonadota bacterium]|nr:hypothetical protein [Pseudomonadota bacterium]